MRFWFDAEFIEDGKTIDLLSIGIVAEDGRTYYATNGDVDLSKAPLWVQENVIPYLNMISVRGKYSLNVSRQTIRDEVLAFVGTDKPEFWAYYADYDWVTLCQLFGTMMDLPKGWPMYCRDVKQLCDDIGNPTLPRQSATEHHALADALWTQNAWAFLQKHKASTDERIKRLEVALLKARDQIKDQQAMPDAPTWIDEVLKQD